MKKHTIKLLTVAITLAAILTLTGCPGPVNTIDPVVVPEYKITVNVTHGTAEYPTTAKAGDPVTITATAEEGYTISGVASAFTISDYIVNNNRTVITLNFSMVTEDVVINMAFGDDLEETPYMLTYIAGGCDDPNCPNELRYQYVEEDDYQIMAYVYSSVEDVNSDNKEVLYFSFPNNTTDIPQIVIGNNGPEINIDNLIQMKSGYVGRTVKYFGYQINWFLQDIEGNQEYHRNTKLLTNLENKDASNNVSPIYIVIE